MSLVGVAGHPPRGYTVPFQTARPLKVALEKKLGMRFNLVDRIVEVTPGRAILAYKNLTLGEEYLADHFPTFPVMPGVLMLQTLVEAGSWLLRATDDFRHSIIVLREAKGVKYGSFMQPGNQMRISVELTEQDGARAHMKGRGDVDGHATVSARLTLHRYNLCERDSALKSVDDKIVQDLRARYQILTEKRLEV